MLARQAVFSRRVSIFASQSVRFFAAEKDGEWGIKYSDECLKFEKEWEQIANKVDAEQGVYLKSELSELQ
jgi:hypothetical protein